MAHRRQGPDEERNLSFVPILARGDGRAHRAVAQGEGYAFHDRLALPPGEPSDARIHAAVGRVTLRLPHHAGICLSGRYTLTELKFAEQRPGGARPPGAGRANADRIHSTFLRAVTILKPQGNLVAEVTAKSGA